MKSSKRKEVSRVFALSIALVIASGLTHAVWNLYTKQSRDKSAFLWLINAPTTAVLLPYLIWELTTRDIPPEAYWFMLASFLLQFGYAYLLSKTYEAGDMSQVYPIMRGTSTLLIPVFGVTMFEESLSIVAWIGLLGIIAGFFINGGWMERRGRAGINGKALLLAVSVGLFTTLFVLADKLNIDNLSPFSMLEVANLGFMLALTPATLRDSRWKLEWRANRNVLLLGILLSPGSYLLFLLAMKLAPIAYISPIREIGTVFGTVLGIAVLKELQGRRRIIGATVIAFGIAAIGMAG